MWKYVLGIICAGVITAITIWIHKKGYHINPNSPEGIKMRIKRLEGDVE